MLVWLDGRQLGTIGGGSLEYRAIAEAKASLLDGKPRRLQVHLSRDLGMCCGGAMDLYIEPQKSKEKLVVYGAGHVAGPTVMYARSLGFEVTVVDERAALLSLAARGIRVSPGAPFMLPGSQ